MDEAKAVNVKTSGKKQSHFCCLVKSSVRTVRPVCVICVFSPERLSADLSVTIFN